MRYFTNLLCVVLSSVSLTAIATSDSRLAYADVVSVKPITRTVHVPDQRQECWDEVVNHTRESSDGVAGGIVGGIVGGVVGHQIGKGSGKTAATIAGSVLGASVGHSMHESPTEHYQTTERRCKSVDYGYDEERVEAYRVTYRYDGHEYKVRTPYAPGEKLKVRVTTIINPVISR